tara:strand:- start:21 stop:1304 length:1284 start_codon:yes stop_codon:yes gene_type:complete
MAKEKPHINLIFVGHVDHGKSTAVGRLLFDSGTVDEQTLRKLKEKAEQLGKGGFEFAFVMDNLKEEQERGVTIDLSYKKFKTDKFEFTIIDAPGHKDFIKNMITGSSQADAGVVVVSAPDGIQEQTKEHIFLARTLGVSQLIIAVNKMDVAKWAEDKFEAVKKEVSELLKQVNYDPEKVAFVPMSAYEGDNVVKKSENMSWYSGPTLVEQLDTLTEPEKPTDLPLRLPLQDVYNIKGIGVVPVGRVETGVLKLNEKVIISPAREGKGVTAEVKTIEMHHEQLQSAEPGDNIGFNLRGVEQKDITRGDVLGSTSNPPTIVKEFTAQIVVLNHPTVLTVGYTPVFHIHTSQVACKIEEIIEQVDPASGQVTKEKPDMLKNGEAAKVRVIPSKPLVIEKQAEIPQMSRFAIRDAGQTVAAGMCIDLVKKE